MTIEELLRKDPLVAVKKLAAEELSKDAREEWFVVSSVDNITYEDKSIVYLELNGLFVPYEVRSSIEQPIELIVDKLNLNLFNTSGPLYIKMSSIFPNKTYVELLNEKFSNVGLIMTDRDIVDKKISVLDTEILANNKSIRWYGKLDINVDLVVEDISRFVKRKDIILEHTVDFNIDSVLVDLTLGLNRINVTELPIAIGSNSTMFVNGIPSIIDNEISKVNTSIDVRFTYPYSGILTLNYNRRTFPTTYSNPIHFKSDTSLTFETIVETINQKLKSDITIDEINTFTPPTVTVRGEEMLVEGKYRLSIKESSIAHLGDIWITLERDYGD